MVSDYKQGEFLRRLLTPLTLGIIIINLSWYLPLRGANLELYNCSGVDVLSGFSRCESSISPWLVAIACLGLLLGIGLSAHDLKAKPPTWTALFSLYLILIYPGYIASVIFADVERTCIGKSLACQRYESMWVSNELESLHKMVIICTISGGYFLIRYLHKLGAIANPITGEKLISKMLLSTTYLALGGLIPIGWTILFNPLDGKIRLPYQPDFILLITAISLMFLFFIAAIEIALSIIIGILNRSN